MVIQIGKIKKSRLFCLVKLNHNVYQFHGLFTDKNGKLVTEVEIQQHKDHFRQLTVVRYKGPPFNLQGRGGGVVSQINYIFQPGSAAR